MDRETINPFCAGCERGSTEICCINSSDRLEFTWSYIQGTLILGNALIKNKSEEPCLFHPLAFMIRHSFELVIKSELINKCGHEYADLNSFGKHRLADLIDDLKCDTKIRDYVKKEEIMLFDKNDIKSMEFRYPVSKNDIPTCKDLCCFGILETMELTSLLQEFLMSEYPDRFKP